MASQVSFEEPDLNTLSFLLKLQTANVKAHFFQMLYSYNETL